MKKKNVEVSIIITAENKEQYITKTIDSCINQNYKKYEIIVSYTNLRNEKILKKKYKLKNIKFLKIKKKLNNKTQDQIFKIFKCLYRSQGKYLFLLDGDDLFKKNKTNFILKNFRSKSCLVLDGYYLLYKNVLVKNEINKFKKNFIYKKLINSWPKNVITSSISIERKLFINFFKEIKFYKYKYLAIDILLAIYSLSQNKLVNINNFLTIKTLTINSVDSKFQGFFNKYFWLRRLEQHNYYHDIVNKKNLSIDYLCTLIITKIINIYSNIFFNDK